MSFRKLLLALGMIFVVAGLALSLVWMRQMAAPVASGPPREAVRPARLVALRNLPAGTFLRPDDFGWKEFAPTQPTIGWMLRGQVNETDLSGSVTRRPFAAGEPLTALELVRPGDKRFLAAVLRPGYRAVSIAVDAPQTSSGLMLAGDYVDVILTQNFGDNIAKGGRRTVGESVLRDVRVVAIDHSLGPQTKAPGDGAVVQMEARIPKTVTLEVTERQGHTLFMASQLGKIHLAMRALEGAGNTQADEKNRQEPTTWASDVSRALHEMEAFAEAGRALGELRNRLHTALTDTSIAMARALHEMEAFAEAGRERGEIRNNLYSALGVASVVLARAPSADSDEEGANETEDTAGKRVRSKSAAQRVSCDDRTGQYAPNTGIVNNIRKVPSPGCFW